MLIHPPVHLPARNRIENAISPPFSWVPVDDLHEAKAVLAKARCCKIVFAALFCHAVILAIACVVATDYLQSLAPVPGYWSAPTLFPSNPTYLPLGKALAKWEFLNHCCNGLQMAFTGLIVWALLCPWLCAVHLAKAGGRMRGHLLSFIFGTPAVLAALAGLALLSWNLPKFFAL